MILSTGYWADGYCATYMYISAYCATYMYISVYCATYMYISAWFALVSAQVCFSIQEVSI